MSIQQDDSPDFGTDETYNAFLADLTGEEAPAAKPKADKPEETDDATVEAPETEADPTEHDGAEEVEDEEVGEDNPEFDIKVGDEIKKAKLSDLKRLFGQEAALTRKSQALAERVRETDTAFATAKDHLDRLTAKSREALEPYEKLDFALLASRMQSDEYLALRADFERAKADHSYFTQEAATLQKAQQERAMAAHREASTAAIKVLEDPKTGIEGFGPELYNKIVGFAAKSGLNNFGAVTDPAAIKLMNDAMQWRAHQSALESAEGKAKKVANRPTPSKTAKPAARNDAEGTSGAKTYAQALSAMKKAGGNSDSTVAAFMSLLDS